jgi:hypothetical protein
MYVLKKADHQKIIRKDVVRICPPLPPAANTAKMAIPLNSPFIFLLSMWQVEALPFLANKGLDGAKHKVRIVKSITVYVPSS